MLSAKHDVKRYELLALVCGNKTLGIVARIYGEAQVQNGMSSGIEFRSNFYIEAEMSVLYLKLEMARKRGVLIEYPFNI